MSGPSRFRLQLCATFSAGSLKNRGNLSTILLVCKIQGRVLVAVHQIDIRPMVQEQFDCFSMSTKCGQVECRPSLIRIIAMLDCIDLSSMCQQ